jgi:hypothetical protein
MMVMKYCSEMMVVTMVVKTIHTYIQKKIYLSVKLFRYIWLIEDQTAELVNITLNIFLGRNLSAPGLYFPTIFAL